MGLSAGEKLGPYEIVCLLGAGGMGEVYRARDPRLEHEVAINRLRPVTRFDADRIFSFDVAADGRLVISRGKRVQDIVLIKNAK